MLTLIAGIMLLFPWSNLCEQRVVTKPKNLSGNPVIIKLKRQRKKNCIFPSFISKEKTYSFSIFWVHINQFCRLDVQETFVEPKQSLPWNFEAWKLMENEFIWQIICKHIIIQFAIYLHMQKMHYIKYRRILHLLQPITQQVILLLLVNHFMPVTAISLTYLQLMIPLIKI